MLSAALLAATLGFVSPEEKFGELVPETAIDLSTSMLAFDGTTHLAVWHDHRSGPTGHLFARLLSRTGSPIGSDFNVLDMAGHKTPGQVLYDGINYVVALEFDGFPMVVRVSKTGVVLDPQGVVISASASGAVRMAFDGTNYLLAWSDPRGSYREIRVARVARDGRVLDRSGVVISANASGHADEPDVIFDGTNFLVVWKEGSNLVSARVASDATRVGIPSIFFIAAISLSSGPRLAGRAGGAVAAFLEAAADMDDEPRVVDVVVGAMPTPVSTRQASGSPIVTLNGAGYVVAWHDDSSGRLRAGRFSLTLTAQDGDGVDLMPMATGGQYEPALAQGGTADTLLTFTTSGSASTAVIATLALDSLAASANGAPLASQARDQASPDLTQGATRSIVGWIDRSVDRSNVKLGLARPGSSTSEVEVTTGPEIRNEHGIASDGANRLAVAWRAENGDLRARLFDEAGMALGPEQVLCTSSLSLGKARVAWDGSQFVVTFRREGTAGDEVRLVRLNPDGTPNVNCGALMTALSGTSFKLYNLVVAAGGGTALVIIHLKDESTSTEYLELVRERGGILVDLAPVVLAPGKSPSAAWTGAEFLVVWHESRRWSQDVMGMRVPPMGPVTDLPHAIATGDWDQMFPAIAFDGQRALVVWADHRLRIPDVYGSFVDRSFAPAGPQAFAIASGPQEEESARVVAIAPGRFAVAYTRFDSTPGVFARRVGLRWVSALAQAAGCTQHGECQSGFCVDGVCCDSECGGGQGDCSACTVATGASADGVCTVRAAQTQCRGAASDCDVPEVCDGAARSCPADQTKPDGLACSNGAGVCGGGLCKTGSAPTFTSAVSVQLSCGQTWSYSSAGRPEVAGDGPFTFSARTADGSALPEGFTIDASTGQLSWRTTREQAGTVTIELRVESPAGFDTQVVELVVDCTRRQAGVSCSSAPAAFVLAALALAWRRRRSARNV